MLHVLVTKQQIGAVPTRELQEGKNPDQTIGSFPSSRRATTGNLALLTGWRGSGRVNTGGQLEHAGRQPLAIVDVVEGGTGEQRREKEHIASVVDNGGKIAEGTFLLVIGQLLLRQTAVVDVPAEGGELHDQNHLGTGDVNILRLVPELAIQVVDGHVAHQEDEADPWHQRALDVFGNDIGTGGADEQGAEASPEVEETDEVEERNTAPM